MSNRAGQPQRLVIASGNAGKLREFASLLSPLGFEVQPLSDFGVSGADEPHSTFVENALAKARHASLAAGGLPALADDSGLCVAVLGGMPGVRSARWALARATDVCAPPTHDDPIDSDGANNRRLLADLDDVAARTAGGYPFDAHYYCVLVLMRSPDDPQPLVVDASWPGQVVREPRGRHGFGYDPLFLLPDLGVTAAELEPEHKNRISHRGRALRALVKRLHG